MSIFRFVENETIGLSPGKAYRAGLPPDRRVLLFGEALRSWEAGGAASIRRRRPQFDQCQTSGRVRATLKAGLMRWTSSSRSALGPGQTSDLVPTSSPGSGRQRLPGFFGFQSRCSSLGVAAGEAHWVDPSRKPKAQLHGRAQARLKLDARHSSIRSDG